MAPDGKRVRQYYEDEKDALRAAAALRSTYHQGKRGGLISHELAIMAASANELLMDHGVTILDAARAYVSRLENNMSPETFKELYQRAIKDNEGRWRDRYMLDMERLPRWVGNDFMATRAGEITPAMILRALKANGAAAQSTIDNRGRYVSSILNYQPSHRKESEITIMTPRQCGQMLRACESPEERRAVALLIWAGIRPDAEHGEITRLDWESVGGSVIFMSRAVSKVSDRNIPITPRLRRLLRGHPESGNVVPANWRRVYKRLRAAVDGIAGKQDVMRHTFASHYLAAYGEDATKQAMGHTAGSQTLFRHYRKAVETASGKKFFGDHPPAPELVKKKTRAKRKKEAA